MAGAAVDGRGIEERLVRVEIKAGSEAELYGVRNATSCQGMGCRGGSFSTAEPRLQGSHSALSDFQSYCVNRMIVSFLTCPVRGLAIVESYMNE